MKTRLHKERWTLEEEKDNFIEELGKLDENIQILEKRNGHLQTIL